MREERPVPSLQISSKINLPSDTGEGNFTGDFVGDSTIEGAILASSSFPSSARRKRLLSYRGRLKIVLIAILECRFDH